MDHAKKPCSDDKQSPESRLHGIPMPANASSDYKPVNATEVHLEHGDVATNDQQFLYTVDGTVLYSHEDIVKNPKLRRFVVAGWKDVWAAALFVASVVMIIVWGCVNFATYTPSSDDSGLSALYGTYSVGSIIAITLIVLGASVAGALASMVLLSRFPTQLIYIANVLTAVLSLLAAVLAFISGTVFAGILLIVLTVLQLVWLFLVRSRIPFAAALLKLSSELLSRYKAIILCNLLLAIASWVYVVFWAAMATPTMDRIADGSDSAGDGLLLTGFMLLFFWATQVFPNVMHVTTAGVVATWYFAGHAMMPRNPTLASLRRAITTSFGSICFGSLIVAVIRTLRWLAESSQSSDSDFVRCIMVCIIGCLERMVEYFNTYAFVHVAVYGCGYLEAAKRTWELCKRCFFAAYFNDCLVGPTLMLLMIGVSALVGVVVGLVTQTLVFGAFAFFISLFVHSLFFTAVDSTVVTIFVCFAEQPDALQAASPEVYEALHAADQNGPAREDADGEPLFSQHRGYYAV